jgi:hypothetical protein
VAALKQGITTETDTVSHGLRDYAMEAGRR